MEKSKKLTSGTTATSGRELLLLLQLHNLYRNTEQGSAVQTGVFSVPDMEPPSTSGRSVWICKTQFHFCGL